MHREQIEDLCDGGISLCKAEKRSRVCIMIEKISSISSKEEFIEYLQDLATDYTDNRDEWENQTISDYLEQIASWIEDYSISPANDIEWEKIDFKILAQLLYMGKIYEWLSLICFWQGKI